MMFRQHVLTQLGDLYDGRLPAAESVRARVHLASCTQCRTEWESIQVVAAAFHDLPSTQAPDSIWTALEAALEEQPLNTEVPSSRFHPWQWIPAFAALMVILSSAVWLTERHPRRDWEVTRLEGTPQVGLRALADRDRLAVGESLQTDANSRARIAVGTIGTVELQPNSRLSLLAARPDLHRLALSSGGIRAAVVAAPRLFLVETPSSTAVDLGCAYTLDVDGAGGSVLRVTSGWVSLEWAGRESLVPAGAVCYTRPGKGPGTPYFEDASDALRQALRQFDFERAGPGTLDVILREARVRDTLTLWHLLPAVDMVDRVRIADRIAALVPLPAVVSRDRALLLDAKVLKTWREELAWTW